MFPYSLIYNLTVLCLLITQPAIKIHKESIYTVYRWYGLIWEVYGAMDEVSGLRGRRRRNAKWSLIGGTTQSCEGSWMNLFLLDPYPCPATLDSRFPEKTVKVCCLNSLLICLRCVCNMSVAREGHSLPTSIPHFLFVPASLRFIDLAGATRPWLAGPLMKLTALRRSSSLAHRS